MHICKNFLQGMNAYSHNQSKAANVTFDVRAKEHRWMSFIVGSVGRGAHGQASSIVVNYDVIQPNDSIQTTVKTFHNTCQN